MYDLHSGVIALALLIAMMAAMGLCTMLGSKFSPKENTESRDQSKAVQGALLGLLALLLGFTFSLALGRFDDRSSAVVAEANAIGTAWLRTDLLEEDLRPKAKALMISYGAARRQAASLAASSTTQRDAKVAEAEAVFAALWDLAAENARRNGGPVAMGFASSLNDMIDALANRDAAIGRHVPELVLFLLFGTFVILGGIVGYVSGVGGTRPKVPTYAMLFLIVILVFLIIDLDRPRRGLIEVDQTPLFSAVEAMKLPS